MSAWRPGARAFHLAPAPLAVVDAADGTVLAVNRALEHQLGTPADRLCGQVWPAPLGGRRSDFAGLVARVGARGTAVVEGMLGDPIDPVWWRQRIVRVDDPGSRPYLIVAVEDRTRDHQVTEDLARAAHHDELTGLWNRRRFRRELRQLLGVGGGPAVGLALFDVDGFKLINDTHGHAVGDAALVAVADAVRSGSPPGAAVARLSGDEFAAALTAPSGDAARERLERLVERVSHVVVGPSIPDLTLSAGIAAADPGPDADRRVQDLLIDADLDMYAAKTRTRAERRAAFGPTSDHGPVADAWTPGRTARAAGPVAPEPDHRGGDHPDAGDVELWSHPVIEVATGRPVLHDVVLHGVGPVVTFDSLVAVIRLVERHARRVVGQPQQHLVHLPNLPLGAGAAAAWLSRAADDLGLDRSAVTFALDEVHLLEPDAGTVAGFAALRAEGFGLAIDGFGAQVGSLRLVTDLEPDQVWIDRRLLDATGPGAAPSGPSLVASVLALTARLGLRTGVAGVASDRLPHLAALAIDLALVPDDAARRPVGAVPREAAASGAVRGRRATDAGAAPGR